MAALRKLVSSGTINQNFATNLGTTTRQSAHSFVQYLTCLIGKKPSWSQAGFLFGSAYLKFIHAVNLIAKGPYHWAVMLFKK
jgi:hypothetical protein